MPRGGYRPGAGRKKGSSKTATARQAQASTRARTGKRPDEVLDALMNFFFALAARNRPTSDSSDKEVKRFRDFAKDAIDAAKALAPYEVARLKPKELSEVDLTKLSDEELEAYYQLTLKALGRTDTGADQTQH